MFTDLIIILPFFPIGSVYGKIVYLNDLSFPEIDL